MQMKETSTPWLVSYGSSPRARVRLFCFPYAGSAAHIFRQWPQRLSASVEVCAVQPPGRGNRWREPRFTSLTELVAAAVTALWPFMDRPFTIYGHSMGALIGYELARRLQEEGRLGPSHLFVSGCRPPHSADARRATYDLSDLELIEELRRLRGTPGEVLDNAELLRLMLPLLRADFTITDTYRYAEGRPLDCPLTVVGGLEDEEATRDELARWRELTTGDFSLHMLPGDHFFLHSSQAALLEILSQHLARLGDGGA